MSLLPFVYETLCAILYNLYNTKNIKNTHGGYVTFSNTCVFFTFFKPYKNIKSRKASHVQKNSHLSDSTYPSPFQDITLG